jgi:hypothetical protein
MSAEVVAMVGRLARRTRTLRSHAGRVRRLDIPIMTRPSTWICPPNCQRQLAAALNPDGSQLVQQVNGAWRVAHAGLVVGREW